MEDFLFTYPNVDDGSSKKHNLLMSILIYVMKDVDVYTNMNAIIYEMYYVLYRKCIYNISIQDIKNFLIQESLNKNVDTIQIIKSGFCFKVNMIKLCYISKTIYKLNNNLISSDCIVPMCLINGLNFMCRQGKTNILQYNPIDVCDNLKNKILNKKLFDMIPWINNFKGSVELITKTYYNDYQDRCFPLSNNEKISYNSSHAKYSGNIEIINTHVVRITELHPFITLDEYMKFLYTQSKNKKNCIVKIQLASSKSNNIKINITFSNDAIINSEFLENVLKNYCVKSLDNMYMLSDDYIGKYTPLTIISDFYKTNIEKYKKKVNSKTHNTCTAEDLWISDIDHLLSSLQSSP